MDDFGEGRTLQDCAGEHRPGLNTSIMLHLGTALRAYYDGLSSPPVPHDVINAAVPVDRQPRALSACDPASCDLRASISAANSTKANSSARLEIIDEMVLASSGVRRPAPT